MTLDIGKEQWDKQGVVVPDKDNERAVQMYMRSRVSGSSDVKNHEGPTIILVKTADFSPSPSPTSKPSYNDSDDDDIDALTGLSSGGMAGVIIGILAGVIALVTACCCFGCCACCGVQKRVGRRRGGVVTEEDMGVGKEERRRMVARGVELMEQGGAKGGETQVGTTLDPGTGRVGGIVGSRRNEIMRVDDGGRGHDVEDAPPKYTP